MKSFEEYLKYRKNLSIFEMAADPHTFIGSGGEEKETTEVRRTPIFLDQDDILYLKHFPPIFWKQALQKRWGEFLYKVYENREKGAPEVPDEQDITFRYKGGSRLTFKNVQTKINQLYDKLNADPGNHIYQDMRVAPEHAGTSFHRDEFERKAQESEKSTGRKVSEYGYSFLDWVRLEDKKGNVKGAASGYIEPGENEVKAALSRLFHGMEFGWFDKELGSHKKEEIDIGGNNKMRRMPVEDQQRTWEEGRDFEATKRTKRNKKTGEIIEKQRSEDEKIIIRSHMPIFAPGFMIPSIKKRRNEWLIRTARSLKLDSSSTDLLKILNLDVDWQDPNVNLVNDIEYKKALEKRNEINAQIQNVREQIRNKGLGIEEDEDMEETNNAAVKKINEKLRALKNKLIEENKIIKLGQVLMKKFKKVILNYYQDIIKNERAEEKYAKIKAFKLFLGDAASFLEKIAENVRETSPRYDVHQWNAFHYSKHHTRQRPQGRLSGFGAIQPNKQQPERIYELLKHILGKENVNSFWDHLSKETDMKYKVKEGVTNRTSAALKESNSLYTLYVQSICESIRDYNLENVTEDAIKQLQFKSGNVLIVAYAEAYKKEVIDEKKSSVGLPNDRKYKKVLDDMYRFAVTQGSDYCKQLIQLQLRFLLQRWNRSFRTENPWEPSEHGRFTLQDIIHAFQNNLPMPSLDPRTSHSIKAIQELVSQGLMKPGESSDQIPALVSSLKRSVEKQGKTEISKTDKKQKSTNQGVFTKAVELMFAKVKGLGTRLGSMLGLSKPSAATPTAAPATPTAAPTTKPATAEKPTDAGTQDSGAEKTEAPKPKRSWRDMLGLS